MKINTDNMNDFDTDDMDIVPLITNSSKKEREMSKKRRDFDDADVMDFRRRENQKKKRDMNRKKGRREKDSRFVEDEDKD